jgi:hypothetical protein
MTLPKDFSTREEIAAACTFADARTTESIEWEESIAAAASQAHLDIDIDWEQLG